MLPLPTSLIINPTAVSAVSELVKSIAAKVTGEVKSLAELPADVAEKVRVATAMAEIAQAEARAAQELAIANRITHSLEVDIEEVYGLTGDGSLGVDGNIETKTISIGLKASGQKLTRRIYRFRGSCVDAAISVPAEDVIAQEFNTSPSAEN